MLGRDGVRHSAGRPHTVPVLFREAVSPPVRAGALPGAARTGCGESASTSSREERGICDPGRAPGQTQLEAVMPPTHRGFHMFKNLLRRKEERRGHDYFTELIRITKNPARLTEIKDAVENQGFWQDS